MKHQLPPLPYPKTSLEPIISAETLEYHHGKHHRHYVDKLNELIEGTPFEDLSLEDTVLKASGPIFNNAAQAWNHSFYWHCLSPDRTTASGELLTAIIAAFGSFDSFSMQFKTAASEVFGSGWAWLIQETKTGKLAIKTTSNAETPLRLGDIPLLTHDLWEHAYYIDYRNEREKFLEKSFDLLNWDFAARCFRPILKATAA